MTATLPKIDMRDLIRTEYKKCAKDPKYFMRNYCYIQHVIRGRMLFDLYPYQADAVDTLVTGQDTIVLKARQLGFTTVLACYALWLALFQKDKNALVIATKQDTAKNLITKSQFAYDNLPLWLKTKTTTENKMNITFTNGSQIKAVSSSGDAGRSEAVSLLIVDEAAHIENADEIWIAAQATLSTGGQSVIISTPNGVGNFFHRQWKAVEDKTSTYTPIKLTWRDHPERNNDAWHDHELAVYGQRGFNQEHEAEFLGSGNTVFDVDVIKYYRDTMKLNTIATDPQYGNDVWIYQYPAPGKVYLVCADVARGDGLDFSTFHILEAETCDQVAEYRGKIDTNIFGDLLIAYATKYFDALLVIENTGLGWAAVQAVINRTYKNLFYMSDNPLYIEENAIVTNKWNAHDKKRVPGYTTSTKTRPLMISKLDEYLTNHTVKIHSERTMNEMETFIWVNGKAEATEGYTDDLIMALAMGLWVRDTSLKLYQQNMDRQKATLDGISKTEVPIFTPRQIDFDPYKMPIGRPGLGNPYSNDNSEDLRWLLG